MLNMIPLSYFLSRKLFSIIQNEITWGRLKNEISLKKRTGQGKGIDIGCTMMYTTFTDLCYMLLLPQLLNMIDVYAQNVDKLY